MDTEDLLQIDNYTIVLARGRSLRLENRSMGGNALGNTQCVNEEVKV
jgi:hypothetical protein